MPSVIIEIKHKYSHSEEEAIIKAVFDAMVTAFHVTESSSTIRLIVHEPHRYVADPNLEKPDLHTHVSIDAFLGRTIEAKRMLYIEMVNELSRLGIPKNHIEIVLREIPKENWGIRGGQAACDVL